MENRINSDVLKKHILESTITPGMDGQQFMAYIILSQKYPNLTYWSWDGYHCHALADYSINLVWKDKEVIDWTTKEVIATTDKNFWESDTTTIVQTWMKFNGETTKTKQDWLNKQ